MAAEGDDKLFPFFKLARELRDMIYEKLEVEERIEMPESEIGIFTLTILAPTARLLGRQFKREAEQQVGTSTSFEHSDYFSLLACVSKYFPALAKIAPHYTVKYGAVCSSHEPEHLCGIADQLHFLAKGVQNKQDLPGIKVMDIQLELEWNYVDDSHGICYHSWPLHIESERMRSALLQFTDIKTVNSLEVTKWVDQWMPLEDGTHLGFQPNIRRYGWIWKPWMRWDRCGGWRCVAPSQTGVGQDGEIKDDEDPALEELSDSDFLLQH